MNKNLSNDKQKQFIKTFENDKQTSRGINTQTTDTDDEEVLRNDTDTVEKEDHHVEKSDNGEE